jgi:hypothetical protein
MIKLLLTAAISTANAQALNDVVKAQMEVVSACYSEVMKEAVRMTVTPATYERDMRKACASQEEKLSELVKNNVPAALQNRFGARHREHSVLTFFYILQRMVPVYKDQCPAIDYNCIIKLDASSKKPHS